MKKINCLFIDDEKEKLQEKIDEWTEYAGSDAYLFENLSYKIKKSNSKISIRELLDLCLDFDFVVLDQMAQSDEAGSSLAEGLSNSLTINNISHCVLTNQVNSEVKSNFPKIKVFKKVDYVTEKYKSKYLCDGGFMDMLRHIKSNIGFNKYCRFLKFTNNQYLKDLLRVNLSPLMDNYLESGKCVNIDNGDLLKFCDFLCQELVNKEIFPNFSPPFYSLSKTTTSIIEYLNFPKLFLNHWLSHNYFSAKQTFENESKYCKEKVIFKDSMKDIILEMKSRGGKKPSFSLNVKSHSDFFDGIGIGDSFCSTLIGQSLNTIWQFRCSDGHKGQNDQNNHAIKSVYESILLVCERLSIIFERIDELEKLAVGIEDIDHFSEDKLKENPVEETSVSEEKQEEAREDDNEDNNEESSEAAIEKGEDVIKNDDEKEKIPSYRQKLPDFNILGKIDLDKFK